MYIFKTQKKEDVLQGRTTRYLANEILDVHEFYLGDVLRGKIGCSKRLAKQITRLISPNANIEDYFMVKEK